MRSKRKVLLLATAAVTYMVAYAAMAAEPGPQPATPKQAPKVASATTKPLTAEAPSPLAWPERADLRRPDQIPQEEQEQLGMEFLRAYHPLRAYEIELQKKINPAVYYQTLREALFQRMELERLRRDVPEEFARREQMLRLEARCEQLAIQYREATADKKPAIEKQLRELADHIFELRQQQMEDDLKRLEREYERLKRVVEKRRRYKDHVIDVHVVRLLGEDEIFELW